MHHKTPLVVGLAIALGGSANAYAALIHDLSFNGWMTFLSAGGTSALVNNDATQAPMYGNRTPITGTMSIDTTAGSGSATIQSFSFFGSGLMVTNDMTIQAIGDGSGGSGPLLLGNWTNDWNNTVGISRSIVWDATGLLTALGGGVSSGDVITGGSFAATEDFVFGFGKSSYTLPMGPGPVVATTWNTTPIGSNPPLGTSPSGGLPLTDDGIGGSPDVNGPTQGFNLNFDFTSFVVESTIVVEECPPICPDPDPVPLPTAIWLLGSGLIGLIGIARRKKRW